MAGVKPKKHLGQHFLTDKSIAADIVAAMPIVAGTELLEIGPGTGVLTEFILQKEFENFIAMDLDTDSIAYLKKHYPDHSHRFLYQDFLHADLGGFFSGKFSVIGNFPYNISSQIFFKLLEHRENVDCIVGMLQKEVAERLTAKHGSKAYGILSVLLQAHFDLEYLFTVEPGSFYPPPKVRSGVIRVTRKAHSHFDCDAALFKTIVKTAFQMRRKTLRNALKGLNLPTEIADTQLFDKRAEQLSVQDFISLTNKVSSWNK